jgi:hypothetical protein
MPPGYVAPNRSAYSSVSKDLPTPPNPLTMASPDACVPMMRLLSLAWSAE